VALLSDRRLFGLALLVALAGVAPAGAAGPPPAAEAVKAAFICNFADFVVWPAAGPAERADTLTIGILGDDPFGRLIDDAAKARSVPDRRLEVARLESPEEAPEVEILFVAASEEKSLPAILEKLRGHPVLTVGDLPGFAAAGGVIGLLVEDKRVRLEINVAASQRAGLEISSRLLMLARLVEDALPPPAEPAEPEPPTHPPQVPALGGST
jgi:hypothetical protein